MEMVEILSSLPDLLLDPELMEYHIFQEASSASAPPLHTLHCQ